MDWAQFNTTFQRELAEYTQDQWKLQFDDNIRGVKTGDWELYIRSSVASFKCSLCKRTWPSNLVTVIFHFRLNKKTHQGTVKVRPYRQECKKCTEPQMEPPKFHVKKIETLMENLVKNIRRKCYDETFDFVPREDIGVLVRNPHEPEHCEGCKDGVCAAGMNNGGRERGYTGRGYTGRGYRGRGYRGRGYRGRGYRGRGPEGS